MQETTSLLKSRLLSLAMREVETKAQFPSLREPCRTADWMHLDYRPQHYVESTTSLHPAKGCPGWVLAEHDLLGRLLKDLRDAGYRPLVQLATWSGANGRNVEGWHAAVHGPNAAIQFGGATDEDDPLDALVEAFTEALA